MRTTKGCDSTPQHCTPASSAARSVVAEPANGSNTRTERSRAAVSRISDSAHCAENPALYRNQRWTGSDMFATNVDEFLCSAPVSNNMIWFSRATTIPPGTCGDRPDADFGSRRGPSSAHRHSQRVNSSRARSLYQIQPRPLPPEIVWKMAPGTCPHAMQLPCHRGLCGEGGGGGGGGGIFGIAGRGRGGGGGGTAPPGNTGDADGADR